MTRELKLKFGNDAEAYLNAQETIFSYMYFKQDIAELSKEEEREKEEENLLVRDSDPDSDYDPSKD